MILKALQKAFYDFLSWKPFGPLFLLLFCFLSVFTLFYFTEILFHQLIGRDEFPNFLTDTIDRSKRLRSNDLLPPFPIDAVFTWVNGSDEQLVSELQALKSSLEEEQDLQQELKCILTNCVLSDDLIAITPALSGAATLQRVGGVIGQLLETVHANVTMNDAHYSVLRASAANRLVDNSSFTIGSDVYHLYRVYLSTQFAENSFIFLPNVAFAFGIEQFSLNLSSPRGNLPAKYHGHVIESRFIDELKAHQLRFDDAAVLAAFIEDREVTLTGFEVGVKKVQAFPVLIAWNVLTSVIDKSDSVSASRFRDNDELRYALRSLEMHAGWFRRVYLVTNGQVPSWLDLSNDRIRVVTHAEIFADDVDVLPVYSSSAIEAHLHNVPGLSDPFVYFNDDTMLGSTVRPEDFYTAIRGQRVYLTWPVPYCREGCPSRWLHDGYCDKECNRTECDFDGGDCIGHGVQQTSHAPNANIAAQPAFGLNVHSTFCAPGCATSWISDRYCDNPCNKLECAFDGGDCGAERFHLLYHPELSSDRFDGADLVIDVPIEVPAFYLRLSDVPAVIDARRMHGGVNCSVTQAFYSDSGDAVRVVTIAQHLATLHVLLLPNRTQSSAEINVTVSSALCNLTLHVSFRLASRSVSSALVATTSPEAPLKVVDDYEAPVYVTRSSSISDAVRERLERLFDYVVSDKGNASLPDADRSVLQARSDLVASAREGRLLKIGFVRKMAEFIDSTQRPSTTATTRAARARNGAANANKNGPPIRRKVLAVKQQPAHSFLPWESLHVFDEDLRTRRISASQAGFGRALLSTSYADSLKHVNRLYNRRYGYAARSVPGHMPHFIQKDVLRQMQELFSDEWAYTRRQKLRSGQDMQFAFAYFYYLMSETQTLTTYQVCDDHDTDRNGLLSGNELHSLLAKLHGAPVKLSYVDAMQNALAPCGYPAANASFSFQHSLWNNAHSELDRLLSRISVLLPLDCAVFNACAPFGNMLRPITNQSFSRFKFETIPGEEDVWFRMLSANATTTQAMLDEVRANPKRFLCLNDNIEVTEDNAIEVEKTRTLLRDFLESQYPLPSQFELADGSVNECRYIDDCHRLLSAQMIHSILRYFIIFCLLMICCLLRATRFRLKLRRLIRFPSLRRYRSRPSGYEVC